MRCPRCGHEHRPGDAFCAGCGAELNTGPICGACGARNRAGVRFCVECGAALTAAPAATVPDEEGDEASVPVAFEPRFVPEGGARAWATPDPAGAVIGELAAGTRALVVDRRGAWARIAVESGWTGWVDDRGLIDPDLVEGDR